MPPPTRPLPPTTTKPAEPPTPPLTKPVGVVPETSTPPPTHPFSRRGRFQHPVLDALRHITQTHPQVNPAMWSKLWAQMRDLDNAIGELTPFGGLTQAAATLRDLGARENYVTPHADQEDR